MEPITVVLPRPRSTGSAPTSLAYRLTISLTSGAEAPLQALTDAPTSAAINCHPCDEAIVLHLVRHLGRSDYYLRVDATVAPGELAISVRLAVAS
ncbi:MAG TPA: hypothetical protein VLR26_13415 [Frankiaceae bacterium]|nr:hypothetical protein [Frankiaceae bacterium]